MYQEDVRYQPKPERSRGLALAGYLLAVLMPVIGFVVGIILADFLRAQPWADDLRNRPFPDDLENA
jgi:hypothetical protein